MNTNLRAESNKLSLAALCFGILSVLCSFLVVCTPFLASMAFTFAFLSRGSRKMNDQAIAGTILGILGIIISSAIVVSVALLFSGMLMDFFYPFIDYAGSSIGTVIGG